MKKIKTIALLVGVFFTSLASAQDLSCWPEPGMSDSEIEKAIMEAFKAKGWQEQPVKIVILSRDWVTRRNEATGAILARQVDALVISTTKKGTKCIKQEFSFLADYNGSGYSKTMYLYGIGNQSKIACECLTNLKNNNESVTTTNIESNTKKESTVNASEQQPKEVSNTTSSSVTDATKISPLDKKKPGYFEDKDGDFLSSQGYKIKGKMEGEYRSYSDGKLEYVFNYKNDMKEGLGVEYWENGKIKTQGQYIKDKKEGEWKKFTETGKPAGTDVYVDGERQ